MPHCGLEMSRARRRLCAQRRGRVTLRVLSTLDLESLIDANRATWLDREMTSSSRMQIVRAGFGADVDRAMRQR